MTPKLHFKKFSQPWTQKKLGELYETRSEKNKDLLFGEKEFISVASMTFPRTVQLNPETLHTYKICSVGDIAFEGNKNKKFPFGRFIENDIGDGIITSRFHLFKPKMKQDLKFWKYYVHRDATFREILRKTTNSGVLMKELSPQEFLREKISFPENLEEQKKIGSIFETLDKKISKEREKLQRLQKIKSLLLKNLFTLKNDRPLLRFQKFSQPWTQKKLGELYETRSEKNKDLLFGEKEFISVASMTFPRTMEIKQDYLKTFNLCRVGDIAFEGNKNKKFPFGRFIENDIGDGIVSHVFRVFKPKTKQDLKFWKYYVHRDATFREILRKTTNSAIMMKELSPQEFLREKISFPKNLEEQKKIAHVFETLDKLISLQEKIINHFEKIKSTLLKRCFQ